MRSGSWTRLVVLGCALALGSAKVAMAGPIEELASVAMHPKDPKVMQLRYQYGGGGFIYTADGGASWKLMCGTMITPGEKADGAAVLAGDGSTLVGVFKGLWQGKNGCAWSKPPELDSIRVTDVSNHPTDPDVTFAVTGLGDDGAMNSMLRRDATGKWTELGSKDVAIITRVRVTQKPDGGLRFYQSAMRGTHESPSGAQLPNYFIRVSDDDGTTWSETMLAVDDGTMRLEAIDPTNPDRIVVSIDRTTTPDTILVSNDQGKTFSEYLMLTDLGGLTFAPDGRIWIGDFGNPATQNVPRGLWFSPNLDTQATSLTTEFPVDCVAYQPANNTLFACKRWEFGTVDQSTGAFNHLFGFATQNDFVTCENVDSAAVCKTQLCNDYCGPMHFASAPLCTAYKEPNCGPTADGNLGGGGPTTAGGSGGSIISAGSGGSAPVPSTGGAGAGGSMGGKPPSSGGCATGAPGRFSEPAGQTAFLVLCGSLLLRRYRRRTIAPPLARP
jgi:hypothetical protein